MLHDCCAAYDLTDTLIGFGTHFLPIKLLERICFPEELDLASQQGYGGKAQVSVMPRLPPCMGVVVMEGRRVHRSRAFLRQKLRCIFVMRSTMSPRVIRAFSVFLA